jgi:ribosome-binding factor A
MSKRVSEDTEGRRGDRKERQLCRQVREAVGEALSTLDDDVLIDVWVCDVTPAPDASRLAVLVRGPRDKPPELVKERLERVSGYLRTEVAQAITRKRAPTLTFEILPPEMVD